MCYFITVSVPNNEAETLRSKAPRNLHLIESNNPSINQHMPENYISYIVTTGGCSCDLFSEGPEEDEQEKRISKLRRKYKRKGWSDAKIERSISQAISAAQASRKAGLRDDLRFYLSDVIEELNEMRIVIHWYNSGVETEKFLLPDHYSYQTTILGIKILFESVTRYL